MSSGPRLPSTCTKGPSLLLNEETESGGGGLNQAPGGKPEGLEPPPDQEPVGQRSPSLPSCSRLPIAALQAPSTPRAHPPLPLRRGAPQPHLPHCPSRHPKGPLYYCACKVIIYL